jgi:hypothetical protein
MASFVLRKELDRSPRHTGNPPLLDPRHCRGIGKRGEDLLPPDYGSGLADRYGQLRFEVSKVCSLR